MSLAPNEYRYHIVLFMVRGQRPPSKHQHMAAPIVCGAGGDTGHRRFLNQSQRDTVKQLFDRIVIERGGEALFVESTVAWLRALIRVPWLVNIDGVTDAVRTLATKHLAKKGWARGESVFTSHARVYDVPPEQAAWVLAELTRSATEKREP